MELKKKMRKLVITSLLITLFQLGICFADNFDDFAINTQIEIKEASTKYKGLGVPKDTNSMVRNCINLTNGNFFYTNEDFSIPFGGKLIEFTRTYNSRDDCVGPLGYGWTHSFNVRLIISSDKIYINFVDEDGTRYRFKFPSPEYSDYILPETKGVCFKLRYADGYSLRKKDGIIYFFDKEGKLLYMQDRLGNKIELQYNADGKLIKIFGNDSRCLIISWLGDKIQTVENKHGHIFTYSYEEDRLTKVVDPLKNVSTYTYDPNNNLTQINFQNNDYEQYIFCKYDTQDRIYEYSLDDSIEKVTLSYIQNGLTKVTNSKGFVNEYYWQTISDDNVITKISNSLNSQSFQWNDCVEMVSFTNANGKIATYTYDGNGNLVESNEASIRKTLYTYELTYNQVTQIQIPGILTEQFEYNDNGTLKLKKIQLKDGRCPQTNFISYNKFGQCTEIKNPRGYSTCYTYDTNTGDLNQISLPPFNIYGSYDAIGRKTGMKDAHGHSTNYEYDQMGRILKIIHPDKSTTEYKYDKVGNKTAMKDPNNNWTYYKYDKGNRLIKITDPLGNSTSYEYDTEGNQTKVIDAQSNPTTFEYNELNRKIKAVFVDNATLQYEYDGVGNCVKETDANTKVTQYKYDALNQLDYVIDAENKTTDYDFNVLENLVSVLDANQHKTSYEYNPYWLTRMIDPLGYTIQYSYDECGNLINKIDAENKTTQYTYNSLDRLEKITYPAPYPQTVNYEYDGVGLLTSMTDSTGKTSFSYDKLDRLTGKQLPSGLKTGNGYINYTYDSVGNRKTLTDPFNRTIYYTYDANNRLTNVNTSSGDISYEYNKINLLIKVTYPHPNQITTYHTYDSRNRLTLIENKKASNIISSFSYGYDFMYNRIRQIERNFGVYQGTTTYQYDSLYRLTNITYPDKGVQFTYDAAGNRNTMSSGGDLPTSYEYDDNDRLASSKKVNEQINYQYNKNGNMISKTAGISNWYEYDAANRLKWVKYGINLLMTAEYDGFGRRIEYQNKTLKESTNYVYDGLNVLLDIDTGTNHYPKVEYICANNRIVCKYDLNSKGEILSTYFYHYDGLGSVVNVTTPKAEPVVSYSYDAFGNVSKQVGGWDINKFSFTGKPKELQTGLYYFGARYYDAQTSRFITKDPYLGDELNPKLRHKYILCANNPVSYVDPYGYSPVLLAAVVGALLIDMLNSSPANAPCTGDELLPEKTTGQYATEVVTGEATALIGGWAIGRIGGKILGKTIGKDAIKVGKTGEEEVEIEVNKTLDHIKSGSSIYKRDNIIFKNREGILPKNGKYREWTVDTPGATNRGARRIIVDETTGYKYYTDDHYKSFIRIE